jgi:hypothetical protein
MNNNRKSKRVRAGGILVALFVLFIGGFSLLFDASPFTGLYSLIRFWPVLLVGLGVWLIFKNMSQEKIGVVVLGAILIMAMYSAFSQLQVLPETADEKAVPPGISRIDASMDFVAGTFRIGSTESLYTYRGYERIDSHVRTEGETARLDFAIREEAFVPFRTSQGQYEILLNQNLPISLIVDTGISSCSFDFTDLEIREFVLDGGLSSIEIIFGETNTKAILDMGLSSITIYVPESVGVGIDSEGLISFSVPAGWIKTDEGYKSPNYETATYKITITCDMGLSSVTVLYKVS